MWPAFVDAVHAGAYWSSGGWTGSRWRPCRPAFSGGSGRGGLCVVGRGYSARANGRVGPAVLRVIARVAAGAARSWWVGASVQVSRTFGDGQVGSRSV